MSSINRSFGFSTDLKAVKRKARRIAAFGLPFIGGRIAYLPPQETAITLRQLFSTDLSFQLFRKGRLYEQGSLGSGLTTNAGQNLIAWNEVNNILSGPSLNSMKYHAIGTGTTADAATDYFLQTATGTTNLSGTTNGYMTGVNTVVTPNQIQSVATFTATGAIAVTEWALANGNYNNLARTESGTPTSTSFPDSGATFTSTYVGATVEINASAINTPTTTVMGLVTAVPNGTTLTIGGGWYTLANASAGTPAASSPYVLYPTIFDRKQFAAINLTNTDTLQFTFTATAQSGN